MSFFHRVSLHSIVYPVSPQRTIIDLFLFFFPFTGRPLRASAIYAPNYSIALPNCPFFFSPLAEFLLKASSLPLFRLHRLNLLLSCSGAVMPRTRVRTLDCPRIAFLGIWDVVLIPFPPFFSWPTILHGDTMVRKDADNQ